MAKGRSTWTLKEGLTCSASAQASCSATSCTYQDSCAFWAAHEVGQVLLLLLDVLGHRLHNRRAFRSRYRSRQAHVPKKLMHCERGAACLLLDQLAQCLGSVGHAHSCTSCISIFYLLILS